MIRTSLVILLVLTCITGLIYPLAMTAVAMGLFPEQAAGSLIVDNGRVTGSRLLGRQFDDPKYFWSRPVRDVACSVQRRVLFRIELWPAEPGSTKGEGSTAGGAPKSRSRQQGGHPDRPADILGKRARSTYQSRRGRVSGRPDRASSWSGDLGGARTDRCEYLRSPMGVPRRACGECGSSQSGIRRKMKYLLFVCVATCLPAQELTDRERMLFDRIENLERRLAVLEKNSGQSAGTDAPARTVAEASTPMDEPLAPPGDITMGVNLDGYYAYNFNRPAGGVNALRAYDVSSNSFSLNQATVLLERAADVSKGRRIGGRLDLMFGQATETLQGSSANERRPDVYRHVFQAYGTYVAPVGRGLTVNFGKFASSFGIENNYTKDQINYSRSYWFNFLPYYHMGFQTTYPVTSKLNVSYWLTNGVNQTEDFNGFKSHAVLLNYNPAPSVSANLNYFNGQEHRGEMGVAPRGRSHFVDGYVTWKATDRLTLAAEADYVISRAEPSSGPQSVSGGAGYVRYRFHPRFSLGGRFAYLRDSGGLFSGRSQTLKDGTVTANFDVADGFQMRWEYRRDWSDIDYFVTSAPNTLKSEQNTALLGLIWWFGGKRGAW